MILSIARAFAFLVTLTFRRQLRSRKFLLAAFLTGILALVTFLAGFRSPWSASKFGEVIVLQLLGLFFVPVVTLMFGTGALGDDRDEKTLVYVITRPLPRWMIFTGKLLGVLPLAFLFTAGGLWLLHAVAVVVGRPEVRDCLHAYLPAVCFGTLAYLAFFHFLGAAFRHSTLMAISYVFLVEVILGSLPGIMKRVSISFYMASMIYEQAAPQGVKPPPIFLSLEESLARGFLIGIAGAFVLLGAWTFSRREYHDAV